MNKTKVRKKNSNSALNTQIWKNKLLAKGELYTISMIADFHCSH